MIEQMPENPKVDVVSDKLPTRNGEETVLASLKKFRKMERNKRANLQEN